MAARATAHIPTGSRDDWYHPASPSGDNLANRTCAAQTISRESRQTRAPYTKITFAVATANSTQSDFHSAPNDAARAPDRPRGSRHERSVLLPVALALNCREAPFEHQDARKQFGPGPAGAVIAGLTAIAIRPVIKTSTSDAEKSTSQCQPSRRASVNIRKAMSCGTKVSNTSSMPSHHLAMAPIVCMNFIARRTANALMPINVSLDVCRLLPISRTPAGQHVGCFQHMMSSRSARGRDRRPAGSPGAAACDRAHCGSIARWRIMAALCASDVAGERLPRVRAEFVIHVIQHNSAIASSSCRIIGKIDVVGDAGAESGLLAKNLSMRSP